MLEHAIGLWWFQDQRGTAFQVLVKGRAQWAAKVDAAQAAGWPVSGEGAQEALRQAINVETDPETNTFHNLRQVKEQARRYSLESWYQAWLAETPQSHATLASAVCYYNLDGQTLQLLSSPRPSGAEPEAAVASATHTALSAYDQVLEGYPLASELLAYAERFGALAERLAAG